MKITAINNKSLLYEHHNGIAYICGITLKEFYRI